MDNSLSYWDTRYRPYAMGRAKFVMKRGPCRANHSIGKSQEPIIDSIFSVQGSGKSQVLNPMNPAESGETEECRSPAVFLSVQIVA